MTQKNQVNQNISIRQNLLRESDDDLEISLGSIVLFIIAC